MGPNMRSATAACSGSAERRTTTKLANPITAAGLSHQPPPSRAATAAAGAKLATVARASRVVSASTMPQALRTCERWISHSRSVIVVRLLSDAAAASHVMVPSSPAIAVAARWTAVPTAASPATAPYRDWANAASSGSGRPSMPT